MLMTLAERVGCTLGCSKKGDEAMPVGTLGLSLAGIGGKEVALLIIYGYYQFVAKRWLFLLPHFLKNKRHLVNTTKQH